MTNRLVLFLSVIMVFKTLSMAAGTADLVLGQPDFASIQAVGGPSGLSGPGAIAVDEIRDRVFVADTSNNRVLWWDGIRSFTNGKPANGVIGQPDFSSTLPNRGSSTPAVNTLDHPCSLCLDPNGNLWVADTDNDRVLSFMTASQLAIGMDAIVVVGQDTYAAHETGVVNERRFNRPVSVSLDPAWNLWVSDSGNNRVLRFKGPHYYDGPSADVVLGQPDFVSRNPFDNNGDGIAETVTAATLYQPQGIFLDASGDAWVADQFNNRILRFRGPFASGAAGVNADLVLGQQDFSHNVVSAAGANTLNHAFSVCVDTSGSVWIADYNNNRILGFNGQLTNGMSAFQVIGQPNFVSSSANAGMTPGSSTLLHPAGMTLDTFGRLWAADQGNNRVLRLIPLRIQGINVVSIPNTAGSSLTITGEGFGPGAAVQLVKPGQKSITAVNVVVTGPAQLSGLFDVTGAAPGPWDLVIVSAGSNVVLRNAVTIIGTQITGIMPSRALNTGPLTVVITGENIWEGSLPRLTRAGFGDIPGEAVILSSTQVQCRFDMTDSRTGFWNVTLSSSGATAVLASVFSVHFPSSSVRSIQRSRSYYAGIETDQGELALEIPQEAFTDDLTLSISKPDAMPAVAQACFKACDIGVSITVDKGLQPLKDVIVRVAYDDRYAAGLDKRDLVLAYYDEPAARWVEMDSTAYPDDNAVVARSRHLSLYRVLQRVEALSSATVIVYPNPYRPGSGALYDDPAEGKGMVFSGLPDRVTLQIFTEAGDRVKKIDQENSGGSILWDTLTDAHEKTASGVYLYYITSPDTQEKIKGRFAIIR